VFVLFQAVAAGSVDSSSSSGSNGSSDVSSPVSTSAEGLQMAACLGTVSRVICVMPNVGWNS
jgi:hypothetical protein